MDQKQVLKPRFNEDGKFVKLLIHEDWYETLKGIYDYFRHANRMVKSIGLLEENLSEVGLIVVANLIYILKRVAKKQIEIGKFRYESGGFPLTFPLGVRNIVEVE